MPIQAPHWTDYLNCPVCFQEFGPTARSPVSLSCGHTLCEHCLKNLHRKQCPFDQTVIQAEPEDLAVNTALLQLAGYTPPSQPFHPPCIQALSESDQRAYDVIIRCLEHLAIYLKICANNGIGNRLSRPMQRKLVTLLQCAITDEEGRGRAARAARSLGERSVTELILQHQNPQQLSANLWAAVRARGCQFLGPAMQEEVLKLVLLALEDGSALSRKVLVMFVVQRLEGDFPQASKTSIGHVVQLLYRASCFKVSKRECDSSLMQLKEEFRTYESLRREHDAQIVQIATEAGLRIAPDQWSALLYGDTAHKSHMQSIIDKLQTPQSFAQSVQELYIALQRSGDPAKLVVISMPLDRLANIDPSPDATNPSWQALSEIITAVKDVVSGLVSFLQHQTPGRDSNHNPKNTNQEKCSETNTSQPSPQGGTTPPHRFKVAFCRDSNTRAGCPRGNSCNFSHFEDDMDRYPAPFSPPTYSIRYRPIQNSAAISNGNITYIPAPPPMSLPPPNCTPTFSVPIYQRFPHPHMPQTAMPAHMQLPHQDTYNAGRRMHQVPSPIQMQRGPAQGQDSALHPQNENPCNEGIPGVSRQEYAPGMIPNPQMQINHNTLLMPVPDRPYYGNYAGLLTVVTDDNPNILYKRPDYINPVYQAPNSAGAMANYQPQETAIQQPLSNIFFPVRQEPAYAYDDMSLPVQYRDPPGFPPLPRERRVEPAWPRLSFAYNQINEAMPSVPVPQDRSFDFSDIRDALPPMAAGSARSGNVYMPDNRRAVGADRSFIHGERVPVQYPVDPAVEADEHKLEEGLMAFERRIDTEFKIT